MLTRNVLNDKKHQFELKNLGWKVIVIWECEVNKYKQQTRLNIDIGDEPTLKNRLKRELFLHTYEQAEEEKPLLAVAEDE